MDMDQTGFKNCKIVANDFSNYLIGTNFTNAFIMGTFGATDDFFLLGAPAVEPDSYPILTGNILDSEGNLLFRLVRNVLVANPRDCSKIMGEHIGFEIHDGNGEPVMKVESTYEKDRYVTKVIGTFYDKNRRVVVRAGDGGLHSEVRDLKWAIGYTGKAFAFVKNLSELEIKVALITMETHGAIHEVVQGEIKNQTIRMDGKAFIDASISHCQVIVGDGDFSLNNAVFSDSEFIFEGRSKKIVDLLQMIHNSSKPSDTGQSGETCLTTGRYASVGCKHSTDMNFTKGSTFPKCQTCGVSVAWILYPS